METKETKHHIIFRKSDNELHDVQPLMALSNIIFDSNEHYIIHKKIISFNIDVFITYKRNSDGQEEFIRGFIYKNNSEIKLTSCALFSSLQLGSFCYDNIMICYY
jgi:hypothetical protein